MQKYPSAPKRSNGKPPDGKELARRLYGGPRPRTPQADRSEVKSRAAAYREHLRERFGAGVPEAVVEAFERAYELGWESPSQIEALITGLRAGAHDKQRERCGGRA